MGDVGDIGTSFREVYHTALCRPSSQPFTDVLQLVEVRYSLLNLLGNGLLILLTDDLAGLRL